MGESKVPLFAFVDETGNTGHNIFDETQPDFYTAALITRGNFDTNFGDRVKAIASQLGYPALHGKELGLGRIEQAAADILELLEASRANFFVSRVEKQYLLVTKMFDTIFDSGENAAVAWRHYNIRALRLILTFKLSLLIEDDTARDFWKCLLEQKEDRARAGLVKVCDALLTNIDLVPDEGSRKVLGEGLSWARNHPKAFQLHVDRKLARQGHFPNLVAFTNLLHGLEAFAKRYRRRVARITHDQQSEFERTLKTYHDLLSTASSDEIRWAGETYSLQAVAGSTFETKEDSLSAGIQLTDVVLWLYSQSKKHKPLPPGCQAIMAYVFINGWESDFSFSGVDGNAKELLDPALHASVSPEAFAAGQVLLKQYEDERLRSIKQYDVDGLPPFMRPRDWLGSPSGSGQD